MIEPPRIQSPAQMEQVWEHYRNELQNVEERIQKDLFSQAELINQISNHILKSGGKRIRPLVLLAASGLTGHPVHYPSAIILASAVEFIHTATLLHDDVIDQAEIRRGQKAAHMLWGNKLSVLVGDYLYTQALSTALTLENHTVNQILAEACRRMIEGETLQLSYHGKLEIAEAEYMWVIQRKTAALLSATCRLGGVISGMDTQEQNSLAKFGHALGIAYQLADDTLDYIADEDLLGKSLGKDLCEGKITLPLLHLLSHCDPREREWVKQVVASSEITEANLQDILKLMQSYSSLDYALSKAKSTIESAKEILVQFPDSVHRQTLFIVADYVVSRDH